MIPAGTQIWIVAGFTDMRYGFTGLSAKVQNALHESPLSGKCTFFAGAEATGSRCCGMTATVFVFIRNGSTAGILSGHKLRAVRYR